MTTLKNLQTLPYLYGISFTPMKTFRKLAEKFGDVICLQFGKESVYFVNDPGVIRHILKTNVENYTRGKSIEDLKPLLGNGLFLSEGELWQKQRKLLTPAFHNSQMEKFYSVLSEELTSSEKKFNSLFRTNTVFNLEHEFKIILLKLTLKNLVSSDLNFEPDDLLSSLDVILAHTTKSQHNKRQFLSLIRKKQIHMYDMKSAKKAFENIAKFTEEIFAQAISGKIQPGNLLQILIESYSSGLISAQQVKDEIQTIIFAGHDTVAEELLWLIYFVSKNENANRLVSKELINFNPSDDLSKFTLNDTPYLTACIRETLRLIPSAWSFYRTVKEDDSFEDYKFPKGSFIMISPYILHRNKKYWSDAEVFKPERFLNEKEIDPYYYIPFGQGPHICIGNRLAMVEIHILVCVLLKKYRFNFISPSKYIPETKPTVIVSSKKHVKVKIDQIL